MADGTPIEWTDATWQVVTGCSIESPGCKNCYAMKLAGTRLRNHPSRAGLTQESAAGPVWTGEVRFNREWLEQPLAWQRARMIFVAAHGDLFHPGVREEWLDLVFAVMALAKKHTFQVLTKRTAAMQAYVEGLGTPHGLRRIEAAARTLGYSFEFEDRLLLAMPLRNVWLGTSVEDQRYADVRREPLSKIAAAGWLTWVSYEPALGPVDWTGWEFLRWLVSGGESGVGARPAHPEWHRSTRDFCAKHGLAYLFKQWGAWLHEEQGAEALGTERSPLHRWAGNDYSVCIGKKAAGRLLDGVEHNGFPELCDA